MEYKLKTEELRLGSWLYDSPISKYPMKVIGYYYNTIYLDFDGNESDCFELEINDVRPIPLTKEILELNGINKMGFSEVYIKDFDVCSKALSVNLDKNEAKIKGSKGVTEATNLQYVHQLQNFITDNGLDIDIKSWK